MTFDEWKKLADKAKADATPQKKQPMDIPRKSRGDRDLFGDLLDDESSSSVTSSSICTMLAEKLELAKETRPVRSDGKVGDEVEQLIKSTASLCANTHFKNDSEGTQKLKFNELRAGQPLHRHNERTPSPYTKSSYWYLTKPRSSETFDHKQQTWHRAKRTSKMN